MKLFVSTITHCSNAQLLQCSFAKHKVSSLFQRELNIKYLQQVVRDH